MDNKQATQRLKEHKILFSHDHGYDETTIQALDIAIKSLEAWDEVIEDLENLSENMTDGIGGSKFTVNFIIKMIKEYMGEIEE